MWWTRREFFKGSTAAVAGAYGLFPALGLAEHVPDRFRQALMPRIDREGDAKQRLTLIRQPEAVMEQDPPWCRSLGRKSATSGTTM